MSDNALPIVFVVIIVIIGSIAAIGGKASHDQEHQEKLRVENVRLAQAKLVAANKPRREAAKEAERARRWVLTTIAGTMTVHALVTTTAGVEFLTQDGQQGRAAGPYTVIALPLDLESRGTP